MTLIDRLEAAEDVAARILISREFGNDVTCQFCGDSEFDLIGLKNHIERGWCATFELIPTLADEADLRARAKP